MHVLVADAFATEPTGGCPVAVFPEGGLADDQYAAVAAELGADGAVVATDDGFRTVGPGGDVAAAVAIGALTSLGLDPGEVTLQGADLPASVVADGRVQVDLPAAESRPVDPGEAELAEALGIDRAALTDVGADLPPARVGAGEGYLAVPVNFMEHLAAADPDREAIADLLAATGTEGVYAFTFDTLAPETTWHARVFTRDGERAVSARAAAACGTYARRQGALDADAERAVAASGQFVERPSRVTVDLTAEARASGRAVVAFDGSVTPPEPEEDDILEA
jgi:predicted PhzF superfamily epimerase YddE/YHI9